MTTIVKINVEFVDDQGVINNFTRFLDREEILAVWKTGSGQGIVRYSYNGREFTRECELIPVEPLALDLF